jgi:hypothetical protein
VTWEEWLRKAAQAPSLNEDAKRAKTEQEIKLALRSYEPLKGRPYVVYAKGSYANNTNVRLDYDVDIAVEYVGTYFCDMMFELEGRTLQEVGGEPSTDPYTVGDLKHDVRAALVAAYGGAAITDGEIAYRVRERKTTLPADVVPCWLYRRYDAIAGGRASFHEGSRVFPRSGGHKDNYPKIQVTKGTAKNERTGRRYKRMVRALKKLQTHLVESGKLGNELASYLIECLVYTVPDSNFNTASYLGDMQNVLATIYNATLADGNIDEWLHVHELVYLFGPHEKWTPREVQALAGAAWNELGLG